MGGLGRPTQAMFVPIAAAHKMRSLTRQAMLWRFQVGIIASRKGGGGSVGTIKPTLMVLLRKLQ